MKIIAKKFSNKNGARQTIENKILSLSLLIVSLLINQKHPIKKKLE
jgi:hypothetical protein